MSYSLSTFLMLATILAARWLKKCIGISHIDTWVVSCFSSRSGHCILIRGACIIKSPFGVQRCSQFVSTPRVYHLKRDSLMKQHSFVVEPIFALEISRIIQRAETRDAAHQASLSLLICRNIWLTFQPEARACFRSICMYYRSHTTWRSHSFVFLYRLD